MVDNVILEDEDIVLTEAPRDDELERMVLDALDKAGRPVSWRELKRMFSGIAGEDRLRKIVYSLKVRGEIVELVGTRYVLPKYADKIEYSRVKNPAALHRIRARAA